MPRGSTPMQAGSGDFDLSAAWARRTKADLPAFLEALAVRLEAALPEAVDVVRRRDGLFSRSSHVTQIAVRLDAGVLALAMDHGRLRATRTKVVRGVAIGSTEIGIPTWLEEVLQSTRTRGEDAERAHGALHDFLLS